MSSRLDAWERRTTPILTALAAAAVVTLVLEAASTPTQEQPLR